MSRKLSRVPSPSREIVAEHLTRETIEADWNTRELASCAWLNVRIVMRKTFRWLKDDEKTIRYTISTVADAELSESALY